MGSFFIMADKYPKYPNQTQQDEHDNSTSPYTKRSLMYGWDSDNLQKVRLKVNSDGELPVNLEASDIEIGAVEIKNSTDDTRATVGANGLNVDVQASALPTGASTSAKQDTLLTELQLKADVTETQPVSIATMPTTTVTATNLDIRDLTAVSDSVEVKQATGTNLHVVVDTAPTTAVTGTFWQATQPVSLASVPSHAVTNAGTFAVQNDAATPAGTNAIGKVGHDITGTGHGVTTVTTAGTDVALAGSTACKKVIIQSQTDNTNLIAVGATGVDATIATGTGIVLYPGDSVEIEIDNLADLYIDSLVNGEGVRYQYFS